MALPLLLVRFSHLLLVLDLFGCKKHPPPPPTPHYTDIRDIILRQNAERHTHKNTNLYLLVGLPPQLVLDFLGTMKYGKPVCNKPSGLVQMHGSRL